LEKKKSINCASGNEKRYFYIIYFERTVELISTVLILYIFNQFSNLYTINILNIYVISDYLDRKIEGYEERVLKYGNKLK